MIIRPNIIDIEASGFGRSSYPIEIGLAMTDKERYCRLIKPCAAWTHWDTKAESMHQISREILMTNGKSVQRVAQEVNALLGEVTVYSDGWVVDKPWITRLYERAGIKRTFHVSPLEMILSEEQMQIWHKTKDQVVEKLKLERHRASTDAYIIQETFMQTYQLTH